MIRPPWSAIKTLCDEYDYTTYQEDEFCCARTTHTDPLRRCLVCLHGDQVTDSDTYAPHTMTETRIACASPFCLGQKPCPFKWKVWSCLFSSNWLVLWNGEHHARQHPECGREHPPVVTDEMKKYILQQDESMIPPRLILSNMISDPDIVEPKRGYPSLQQVSNCAKYLRRRKGTKNALYALRQMVQQLHLNADSEDDVAFIFGAKEDEAGFAFVGEGVDDDPFILGVTTRALVNACVQFASADRITIFHADATFKLSDLGYPAITCGFTDASRVYQLGAMFVVSRRTAKEYSSCLQAFVDITKRIQPNTHLHIDFLMGDAEDAQLNAFQAVDEFASATFLMCFFHVLYNVRKRTRHLAPEVRRIVVEGIMHMHYSDSLKSFGEAKQVVYAQWLAIPQLRTFAKYFESQWLESRYWRWQIFHTPPGFATTNNPCESFNATIKVYTGRRRHHMQRLLEIMCKISKDAIVRDPVGQFAVVPPSRSLMQAANAMISSGAAAAYRTTDDAIVRVKQLASSKATFPEELEAFRVAVDGPFSKRPNRAVNVELGPVDPNEILSVALVVRAERAKAAKLYKSVVKWSLKQAHLVGMPDHGWLVDIARCVCECKYYLKFKSCAHVIVGRKAKKLSVPGEEDKTTKLFNRQIRQQPKTSTTGPAPFAAAAPTVSELPTGESHGHLNSSTTAQGVDLYPTGPTPQNVYGFDDRYQPYPLYNGANGGYNDGYISSSGFYSEPSRSAECAYGVPYAGDYRCHNWGSHPGVVHPPQHFQVPEFAFSSPAYYPSLSGMAWGLPSSLDAYHAFDNASAPLHPVEFPQAPDQVFSEFSWVPSILQSTQNDGRQHEQGPIGSPLPLQSPQQQQGRPRTASRAMHIQDLLCP